MSGRLAIDFGTSNTVIAMWDSSTRQPSTLCLEPYATSQEAQGEVVCAIPSLIHFCEDGNIWIGAQVEEKGLAGHLATMRWMKRYIALRSPRAATTARGTISVADAGARFLSAIMLSCAEKPDIRNQEVALTAPVDCYEHYIDWLTSVAADSGMERFRLIDEASAAALGYGESIRPGDVYLCFDFGGGTLDVSSVVIEEETGEAWQRCRVLGKAGDAIGGATFDQWIYEHVLAQSRISAEDSAVRRVSASLLKACEEAKKLLSSSETACVEAKLPGSRQVVKGEITARDFEQILDNRQAFHAVDRAIRQVLRGAESRGYGQEDIKAVLMVGGSSLIPSVQRHVQRIFGSQKVRVRRPFDAVARGAAAFVAGVAFLDYVEHEYAVRFFNVALGEYDFKTVVPRGTRYPTSRPLERFTIKATQDGQQRFGIDVFEIGQSTTANPSPKVELVFDTSGAARLVESTAEELRGRSRFWMNEGSRTFLSSERGVRLSEPAFEVWFEIDPNKRLLVSAREHTSGMLTHDRLPVIKLV